MTFTFALKVLLNSGGIFSDLVAIILLKLITYFKLLGILISIFFINFGLSSSFMYSAVIKLHFAFAVVNINPNIHEITKSFTISFFINFIY